jgi:hypothetical protein
MQAGPTSLLDPTGVIAFLATETFGNINELRPKRYLATVRRSAPLGLRRAKSNNADGGEEM